MKKIKSLTLLIVAVMLVVGITSSCEFDNSPEPDHPTYVTYTISAGYVNYVGPQQLIDDVMQWVTDNDTVYDTKVDDAKAIKEYEKFVPKFKEFLNQVKDQLAAGAYGDVTSVSVTFYVFAARTQGKDGNLQYEQFEFVYPDSSSQQYGSSRKNKDILYHKCDAPRHSRRTCFFIKNHHNGKTKNQRGLVDRSCRK